MKFVSTCTATESLKPSLYALHTSLKCEYKFKIYLMRCRTILKDYLEKKFPAAFAKGEREKGFPHKIMWQFYRTIIWHFYFDFFATYFRNVHVPRYWCLKEKWYNSALIVLYSSKYQKYSLLRLLHNCLVHSNIYLWWIWTFIDSTCFRHKFS